MYMTVEEIIAFLNSKANNKAKEGMARFGIVSENALGITMPVLRHYANEIKKAYKKDPIKQHELAIKLWNSGIHETKILASILFITDRITEASIDQWVNDFYSWDVCDQTCINSFYKTSFAVKKIFEWTQQEKEFVKRAGYVLMAVLAVHDKKSKDDLFLSFFSLLEKGASDERNFVKKAVNWAIRQIGKRNEVLHQQAISLSEKIARQNSKSAKWIASNALRELRNPKICAAVKQKLA
jgi:3-methyladenine DNA glycosylase AlkD